MSIVSLADLRGAASELSREQLDSLVYSAGYYDKDACGEDAAEYVEQLELGRALAEARRREVARARRSRFF